MLRPSLTITTNLYDLGAQDLRANRPAMTGLPTLEQMTYDAGRRHAFKLACNRLDAPTILPLHFGR